MNSQQLFLEENIKSAIISECGKFRYHLQRRWDNEKPMMTFMMLNPSTADGTHNDNTITRCIGFAKSWGFGGFHVCNLFAFRATKPNDLLKADDPIGPDNLRYIIECCEKSEIIVCAWGNSKAVSKILKRFPEYKPLVSITSNRLFYIELSNDGTPVHPLFLPKTSNLKPYQS